MSVEVLLLIQAAAGRRHRSMSSKNTYRTIRYADGWFELREEDNPDAWLAIDGPVDVDP